MNDLKNIRKKLGFSQHEFAGLIGCKKGQLAMVETSKRKLSGISQPVMEILQNSPSAPIASLVKSQNKLRKSENGFLVKAIKIRNVKLGKLELLAERLENKMANANTMIAVTTAHLKLKGQPELQQMQLTVFQRQAGERRDRFQQQWLGCQVEMAGLQAAIDKAMDMKNIL
jgi:transcriptional regulator with XRE-family HTH domain